MTKFTRLAPALLSSYLLLTATYSYAGEADDRSLDPGSEMFNDTADIGGAFDEPAPVAKESAAPKAKVKQHPVKKKIAKANKKKKLHAANKSRKAHKKHKTGKKQQHAVAT